MNDNNDLEALIHFWKDSLAEHRLLMSPSTVYLVEQTIKSLEELKQIKEEAVDDVIELDEEQARLFKE